MVAACTLQEHLRGLCGAGVPRRRGAADQPDALCGALGPMQLRLVTFRVSVWLHGLRFSRRAQQHEVHEVRLPPCCLSQ